MAASFINLDERDYHIHSSNFSDWLNSIDEIVRFCWDKWMKSIAITDHSQFCIDYCNKKYGSCLGSSFRRTLPKWKNVFNDLEVIFWVEWDLMNETWEVCFHIQWVEPEFKILSVHSNVYLWTNESVTGALIKAIEKHHSSIAFIAHPCNLGDFGAYIDIKSIVDVANEYDVPLEFNAKNFVQWKTHLEKLDYLLNNAKRVYINSDGHTLHEIWTTRSGAIAYLKEKSYI